ncbi:hypothetical protein BKP45_02915 [Anaerobacillus alkalidiazotrophicus]|uniref:X-X-X-Leu-X-X-Gly heptad repeat-containing protein n=1 Tax=Anaerobacillus alkalidiazotrophicus TaxID=472963 RepID=A0A1S2MCX3_9BACI|nr:hypothetical protein [Anaerobacillus alkalidiazotrophicus]OIJ21687.1 hypothetical protein BKP45_02915 [Anaerobacillus alkalidiazotrophicus]
MRKKRLLLVLLAISLLLPSFLVLAETIEIAGELASKDEVVYANLHANGELHEIYIVNSLDVTKPGIIIDYGTYDNIKNLTDLSEIVYVDDTIRINATKGKFYYQGNIKDGEIPWDISISYELDGEKIVPSEHVGKNGHLKITIKTSANENVDPVFFEHYLLQISLMLDPDIYRDIEISDGMIANAGKNKQITFTVMPDHEEELYLKADVLDFELEGIEIAAVPSSFAIDSPDIDEMTEEMKSLTDAIKGINNGVGQLKNGVSDLNKGVSSLRNGSLDFKNGMSEIDQSSGDLVHASNSINKALATIGTSLQDLPGGIDVSDLKNLPGGLTQLANGLLETADGLATLKENYTLAFDKLDDAIGAIPSFEISEEDMNSLYVSGADPAIIDKLIETYSAAQIVRETYSMTNEAFIGVDEILEAMSGSMIDMGNSLAFVGHELSSTLESMDDLESLAQLLEGLAAFSANYQEFHKGLVSYTKGVGQLSNSYHNLHAGIVELSTGTAKLEDGVGELYDGTNQLYEATSELPTQVQEEIDRMIAEYDKSDFDAISFVSSQNEKINLVQFVMKTERIKKEVQETNEIQVEEEKGFWTRLMDLFRW